MEKVVVEESNNKEAIGGNLAMHIIYNCATSAFIDVA
jgi:hypothetical protein